MRYFRTFLLVSLAVLMNNITAFAQDTLVPVVPTAQQVVVPTTQVVPTTTNSQVVITTPAPAPKEVVTIPEGYVNCFTVSAGYYNNVWTSERQVCQYNNTTPGKAAWVGGYWQCTEYNTAGACTAWDWVASHWSDVLTVY